MASLRSINQDDLRNHNLSVVLDSLLRATEPMSRADLAKKTGLTKAAMSVLVSLMLDNEILVEGAPSGQSLYGAPAFRLKSKVDACAAWDCRPTPTVMAWWCSILTVPLWGSSGSTPTWPTPTSGRFSPSRRTGFAAGRSAWPRKVMCLPVPVCIAGSRHR